MEETAPMAFPDAETMQLRYKGAVESALSRLPVKNGVIDIDSIWVETSIPYGLIRGILRRDDFELPANVERINQQSRMEQGERSGKTKRRKRHQVRN